MDIAEYLTKISETSKKRTIPVTKEREKYFPVETVDAFRKKWYAYQLHLDDSEPPGAEPVLEEHVIEGVLRTKNGVAVQYTYFESGGLARFSLEEESIFLGHFIVYETQIHTCLAQIDSLLIHGFD